MPVAMPPRSVPSRPSRSKRVNSVVPSLAASASLLAARPGRSIGEAAPACSVGAAGVSWLGHLSLAALGYPIMKNIQLLLRGNRVVRWLLIVLLILAAVPLMADEPTAPATGPLRVHPTNHRYFTDGSGKAILLTGSHTWANFQPNAYETHALAASARLRRLFGFHGEAQPQFLPAVDVGVYLQSAHPGGHDVIMVRRWPFSGRAPSWPWTASRSST